MIDSRTTAAWFVTACAAFLAACSSGPSSLDEPVAPASLTVEPLADDDPIYRQARVLMQESSQDGQWVMNVVERGAKPFADRKVVLTQVETGRGYVLPQLSEIVKGGERFGTGLPSGEWTAEDAFSFTEDSFRRLPMFTLHVRADDETSGVAVAFEPGPAFPAGQWGVSSTGGSIGRP
jgi:hypothetical protein